MVSQIQPLVLREAILGAQMAGSHPGLKRIYNRLNRLYFDGELPDIEIVWEPTGDSIALSHYCSEGIEIARLTFDPALKGYNKIIKTYMNARDDPHQISKDRAWRTIQGRARSAMG